MIHAPLSSSGDFVDWHMRAQALNEEKNKKSVDCRQKSSDSSPLLENREEPMLLFNLIWTETELKVIVANQRKTSVYKPHIDLFLGYE